MKKFLFILGLTKYKRYRSAMKLAAYYRKQYNKIRHNNTAIAETIASALEGKLGKGTVHVAGAGPFMNGIGKQHTYETLFKGHDFKLVHCTTCNKPIIFFEAEFNIKEDLLIILQGFAGIENIETMHDKECCFILAKGVDKKEIAQKIGAKINEYIFA